MARPLRAAPGNPGQPEQRGRAGPTRLAAVLERSRAVGRARQRQRGQWGRPGKRSGRVSMASSHPRERTALIVTVLDEADSIDALLESVAAQTCLPDEVVVADGGSHDGTRAALE